MSRRSCCDVVGELFLSTSFCCLQHKFISKLILTESVDIHVGESACYWWTYTALPRVTPPQAMNCLFERIGGTAPWGTKTWADVTFPEFPWTTSPFRTTSYCGPLGSTRIVSKLSKQTLYLNTKNSNWQAVMYFATGLEWRHRDIPLFMFSVALGSESNNNFLFLSSSQE